MSVPNESALLAAFARVASKAHEIDALFQDRLLHIANTVTFGANAPPL